MSVEKSECSLTVVHWDGFTGVLGRVYGCPGRVYGCPGRVNEALDGFNEVSGTLYPNGSPCGTVMWLSSLVTVRAVGCTGVGMYQGSTPR